MPTHALSQMTKDSLMTHGFDTWKDLLEVLIIPVAIFIIGALLPRLFEMEKKRKFLALIKRELEEMAPYPKEPTDSGEWYQHLHKRFLHEEIFKKVSENRDFILSLPPDIAYNLSQMWTHFEKAQKAASQPDILAEHGAFWCDYLRGLCNIFDGPRDNHLYRYVYKPWEHLMITYYPKLKKSERLPPKP